MTTQFSFQRDIWLVLCIIFFVLCYPDCVTSAEKYYYYLHVSSFRLEKSASQDAARLQDKGYDATIRREKVADLGYWYRVYVGPFSSLKEANLKKKELQRRKLVEYVVRRGDSLWKIANRFATTTEAIQSLNNLNTTRLHIGQVLLIPQEATNLTGIKTRPDAVYPSVSTA